MRISTISIVIIIVHNSLTRIATTATTTTQILILSLSIQVLRLSLVSPPRYLRKSLSYLRRGPQ